MPTITIDAKILGLWLPVLVIILGGIGSLMAFGLPVSISHMVQAEEQISRNTRRSQTNKAAITKYSGFVNKLQIDNAVNDAYQKGVQRDLLDAKKERKDLNENVQKIIQLLGTTR